MEKTETIETGKGVDPKEIAEMFRKAAAELRKIVELPKAEPRLANVLIQELEAKGYLKKGTEKKALELVKERIEKVESRADGFILRIAEVQEMGATAYERLGRAQKGLREVGKIFRRIKETAQTGKIPAREPRENETEPANRAMAK